MADSIEVDAADGVVEDDLVQFKVQAKPLRQLNRPTRINSILQETSVPNVRDMATGRMNVPRTGRAIEVIAAG